MIRSPFGAEPFEYACFPALIALFLTTLTGARSDPKLNGLSACEGPSTGAAVDRIPFTLEFGITKSFDIDIELVVGQLDLEVQVVLVAHLAFGEGMQFKQDEDIAVRIVEGAEFCDLLQ